MDDQGIHCMFGCKKDYVRSVTHDSVSAEMCRLIKYCGFAADREELDCFRGNNPDSDKRPDISMQNPKRVETRPHDKLILDIGISCPIHPASRKQLTRDQSKEEARACDRYCDRY